MLSLFLFYVGVSLGTAAIFIALAIAVGLAKHSLLIGAIAFSICIIALYINAVNQSENE